MSIAAVCSLRWPSSHQRPLSKEGKNIYVCVIDSADGCDWVLRVDDDDDKNEKYVEVELQTTLCSTHTVIDFLWQRKMSFVVGGGGYTLSHWDDHDTLDVIWSYVINVAKMIFAFKTITRRKYMRRMWVHDVGDGDNWQVYSCPATLFSIRQVVGRTGKHSNVHNKLFKQFWFPTLFFFCFKQLPWQCHTFMSHKWVCKYIQHPIRPIHAPPHLRHI